MCKNVSMLYLLTRSLSSLKSPAIIADKNLATSTCAWQHIGFQRHKERKGRERERERERDRSSLLWDACNPVIIEPPIDSHQCCCQGSWMRTNLLISSEANFGGQILNIGTMEGFSNSIAYRRNAYLKKVPVIE